MTMRPKADDDQDVEAHGLRPRATEDIAPEGVNRPRASDDDDVEGHRKAR